MSHARFRIVKKKPKVRCVYCRRMVMLAGIPRHVRENHVPEEPRSEAKDFVNEQINRN
jgi:hypothetical protein